MLFRSISCAKGCGACCRQLVAIPLVDALALARLVEAMPEPRRGEIRARFAAATARVKASGVFDRESPHAAEDGRALARDYFRLGVACPFLEDESCSIHAERPLVCREHVVTSPAANCARFGEAPIDRVDIAAPISAALSRATAAIAGVEASSIPLIFALEWAPAAAGRLDQRSDAVEMLRALLAEIGKARISG